MIVAVDAVGAKHGGAAVITQSAGEALAELSEFQKVVVFTSPENRREFTLAGDMFQVIDQPEAESGLGRLGWANNGLARAVDEVKANVVLSLNSIGVAPGVPVVNYYQQPLLYDESARRNLSSGLRMRLAVVSHLTQKSSRFATAHVVQTKVMRARVSATWGIEPNRVLVATPAPPPWNDAMGTRSDDVLWVGNELPYKRWEFAQAIHAAYRNFASDSVLLATIGSQPTKGVEALGRVSRTHLRSLYDSVGALLVTSTVESLGLPLLESMACGCPIVAPDLPWTRSVCDNAALYYDPERPSEAVERLRDARDVGVLNDLRMRMSDRAEKLRKDDGWSKVARLLSDVA